MKRPLVEWLLFFVGGLIVAYYLPVTEVSLLVLVGLIVVTAGLIMIARVTDKTSWLVLVLIFLVGCFYLQVETWNWRETELKSLLGTRVEFRGVVERVITRDNSCSYIIKDLKKSGQDQSYSQKIRLTVWSSENPFQPGDRVLFTSKLKLAKPQKNPGGFSYRNYLKKRGIYAIGEVSSNNITQLSSSNNPIIIASNYLRKKIQLTLEEYFSGEASDFLLALLLGAKHRVSERVMSNYSQLGISHLLVVSGFHIGLISYLLYTGLNYLKLSQVGNLILTSIALVIYLAIINWQLPALRAVLLIIGGLTGKYLERKVDLYNLLAGIALVLLIVNPRSLFTISFQLSFGAVIAISYLAPELAEYLSCLPTKVSTIIAATIAAQLGLFPLLIYYFNRISLISIVANLILMPWISLLLPLAIFFLICSIISYHLSQLLAFIIQLLINLNLSVTEFLADGFVYNLVLKQPSILIMIAYYIVIYSISNWIRSRGIPYAQLNYKQVAIVSLSLVLILVAGGFNPTDRLEVTFFAVGLGDGAYLKTPSGENVLIDGGATGQELISFLEREGISKLDLVFISHAHADHVGGIIEVIKHFEVAKVCYPPARESDANDQLKQVVEESSNNLELIELIAGDKVSINQVDFNVLGPSFPLLEESSANNNSLVLKVGYEQFDLLFTGDIEEEAERRLVSSGDLAVDVLKLAHHGSSTSSSTQFLQATNPQLSIMSVGKNNYGLPDDVIKERLENHQIKNLRTDKRGAVTITTDGTSFDYRCFLNR
ncbi:MAG: DNA internalization-related competence protein ComEC/Rec2 [Bacillota bacterium]